MKSDPLAGHKVPYRCGQTPPGSFDCCWLGIRACSWINIWNTLPVLGKTGLCFLVLDHSLVAKVPSFLSLGYQEPWALGSLIRSRTHQMGQLSKGCLGNPRGPGRLFPVVYCRL